MELDRKSVYRISSNNSRPSNNRLVLTEMFKSPPPPPSPHRTTTTPIGYPLVIPIAVNLENEAKVESDPAKLIIDDSGSDAEGINIENQSGTKFGTL